ncbi:DEAD/DEAH box helicase [Demequina aurantiaca]|uniref:DEAD/DEAH box helicase n=1 Tax=Demequina aurantiaca TaxID=676200 RepID=UPI0009FD73B0|nr:DEAD/DEAH box helicase [Demequina aurantiaca]
MSDKTFGALGVPTPITDVLDAEGKTNAFPIQIDTLPDTLSGRDVLGRGKTGSGKTLAFSIPMAVRLGTKGGRARPGHPRGLILAPTRELATQIDAVIAPLAKAYGLKTTTIFGGVKQHRQEQALRAGADIVVACPGRLEDLMKQGHVKLDMVDITVLDEADHMADLGFLPGVTRIMNATPQNGQRMLFSATLDNGVDKLVKRFLHNQIMHSVDEANSPVAAMTHHVFTVTGADAKRDLVHTLASGTGRRILFMRTKHQAKKLAKQLTAAGIPAVDLHGNLSQNKRDQNLALFAGDKHRVLVATDVAARGVHVDGVELVVHVDPPAEHKAYLHRSGRTARAGSEGDVVTVVLPEQRRETEQLLRQAKINVRPEAVNSESAQVVALVGEVAPYVKPSPITEQPQRGRSQGGRSQGANAQRKRANRDQRGQGGSSRGASSGSRGRPEGEHGQHRPAGSERSNGSGRSNNTGRSNGSGRSGATRVKGESNGHGQRGSGSQRSGGSNGGAAAFSSNSSGGRRSR